MKVLDKAGNVTGWSVDRAKAINPDGDLLISWEQAKTATDNARAQGVSIKEALALMIDTNDPTIPPIQFINFAKAPDVFVANIAEAVVGRDIKAEQAEARKYFDGLKAKKTAAKA